MSYAAELVGTVLDDRYRLDALVGEGGMGAVYRAHHLAMDRRVAVKLLKPHLTGDKTALARFVREARSTMRVDSPHAVKVHDFGITGEFCYMVLEYLDGRTVQRELDVDGPFEPARVVHIARQALHALGAAHAGGLVHRDIKPDNILLLRAGDDPDFTKLVDFGVAKLMEGAARSDRSALAITAAGMVFGTPEFMSSEQACGHTVDGRSDLYSLAATMFAMLTGCGMYRAKSPIEWLTHHARTPPPHLADGKPELAAYPELDAVLQKCLAKHREQRPADAAAMAALLDEIAPTVARDGKRPSGSTAPRAESGGPIHAAPSSYVEAIALDATLVPAPPPSTGLLAHVPQRRRALIALAVGALAVIGVVVVAIALASRDRHDDPPPLPTIAAKPVTAAAIDAAAPVPLPPADAAPIPIDAPPVTPQISSGSGRQLQLDVARHIALAEQAKRTHNILKQIAEADTARRIDPHNAKALILLADGLIASGDNDNGCKYLRGLSRIPAARALAQQAGCPSD